MKTRIIPMFVALAALGCQSELPTHPTGGQAWTSVVASADNGKPMVLQLRGRAQAVPAADAGVPSEIPDTGADGEATLCFTVDLFDASTDRVVGRATDCLSDIGSVGDGLALTGRTFFDFGKGDYFVTEGLTTVQPTTHGSPDITHVTGAIPVPGTNGVIAGAGKFAEFAAAARLSGAVNLSELGDGYITFDCIFVISQT